MKRVVCLLIAVALPLLAVGQETKATPAASKKDVVISTYRITVKTGHDAAFKAAIAAHAQKFHKGDWVWRVGDVISGPGGNVFQIVEGPFTWTALDNRGDLGEGHMQDYDTNVMPHVESTTPDTYAYFVEDMSTVAATQWSNKVLSVHYTAKPGKGWLLSDTLKQFKALNAKRGLNTAVWNTMGSGKNVFTIVYRLPHGWKDFDEDTLSMRKAAGELFGPNEYARLQANLADACESIESELVEYKPELGSK